MKTAILIEGSDEDFNSLLGIAERNNLHGQVYDLTPPKFPRKHEENSIFTLLKIDLNCDLFFIKFSGRESVIKSVGDNIPHMILPLSFNKNSNYYSENPQQTFLDLIKIYKKETNN